MLNKSIAKLISLMPEKFVWFFSKKYIAGKNVSDSMRVSKRLNANNISVTIDVLGEFVNSKEEALAYKRNYIGLIHKISSIRLNASISLKPTMFGLLLDEEFCLQQIRDVVKTAKMNNLSVCMDMEDSPCTQVELDMFEKLYLEFPATITFVVQAYLKRTLGDLAHLKSIMLPGYPINVRLCKGIYIEPESIAFQTYHQINDNYLKCAEYMINNGFFCAFATHDKHLLFALISSVCKKELPIEMYEFQMLYGVRPKLRDKIVARNHPMRVYVPYGTHWYNYSVRRLKENPAMVTHIIKALLYKG